MRGRGFERFGLGALALGIEVLVSTKALGFGGEESALGVAGEL